jgi:hypothetical protein
MEGFCQEECFSNVAVVLFCLAICCIRWCVQARDITVAKQIVRIFEIKYEDNVLNDDYIHV